jgi:hypothetical protein
VSNGRTYPEHRDEGRFFGRRVNCENVPMLPAQVVAWMLDDPRKIPYLLVWKSRANGTAREAVRIAACNDKNCPDALYWLTGVEIKRYDGTRNFIRTILRPLPRNGGRVRLLVCAYCNIPHRGLYGWEPGGSLGNSITRSTWGCWKCNRLRYESEGGGLVHRGRGGFYKMIEAVYGPCRSEPTEPWHPYVFTSPEEAAVARLCTFRDGSLEHRHHN